MSFSRLMSLAAAALMLGACDGAQTLQVDNARVREVLPGRDTTAAYFTLYNNSGQTVTLTGAQSSTTRAIEMHKTVINGDSVGMRRINQHTLKHGERVRFEPGGMHLMIFGLTNTAGPVPITLLFADGQQIEASFSKLAN